MSTEKYYADGELVCIPVCDICGDELLDKDEVESAVECKKRNGWKSRKDDNGEWIDVCPECQRQYPPKRKTSVLKSLNEKRDKDADLKQQRI